ELSGRPVLQPDRPEDPRMSVTSAPAPTSELSTILPFGVRFRLKGVPWIPLFILLLVLIGAIGGETIAPQDPNALDLAAAFKPPFWQAGGSTEHLLGTDNLGRDIFSKIIVGARISVIVSFYAIIFSGAIGTLLGIVAGYFGGWIDTVIVRIAEI